MNTGDGIQIGVGIVLALTLGAVLWYALETRKLAREAREQRLLSTRPILLLSPLAREDATGSAEAGLPLGFRGAVPDTTPVRIINVGTGVAVEARVPYKLELQDPDERVIDYLRAGSDDVEHNFYLVPKEGRANQRVLRITYYDVFGNLYESTREFHKEPDSQLSQFTPLRHGDVGRGGPDREEGGKSRA